MARNIKLCHVSNGYRFTGATGADAMEFAVHHLDPFQNLDDAGLMSALDVDFSDGYSESDVLNELNDMFDVTIREVAENLAFSGY